MNRAPPTPGAPGSHRRVVHRAPRLALALVAAMALAAALLPLDLTALSSWDGLTAAFARLRQYGAGFLTPDLTPRMLRRCADLALDTVAIAVGGTAIGLALACPLALASCRSVVLADAGDGRPPRLARAIVALARFVLDALRGVPDFVWAVLLANVTGVGPVTGLLAIAIGVTGIFGKVLGEQWDQIAPERCFALRSTGAGRLAVFLYGVQPLGARATLSFVLMRVECGVRNASVIGVVGGGGLGAGLWDEYTDGDWSGVATVLLALLVVTASVDVAANVVRRRLRFDPNHPRASRALDRTAARRRRAEVGLGVALLLAASAWWLAGPWGHALGGLARTEWAFVEPYTLGMFRPSLAPDTWLAVLRESLVPLAIAVLATLGGGAVAAALVYPASLAFQLDAARFTGERAGAAVRAGRLALAVVARAVALVLRAVPEAGWVVVLAVPLRSGPTPCVVAIALHSAGVLHRVFTEAVDDVAYRRLERVGAGRAAAFAYGALPVAWPLWRTYLFFQFEVNLRAGVALGIVGAGGLGMFFKNNLAFRHHADAAAFLWGMVLLTVAVDRLSRWLQLRRLRC